MMKTIPAIVCVTSVILTAGAQNLVLNGSFDDGNANWSANGGNNGWFYTANNANPDNEANTIAAIGWWDGVAAWQNTTATVQPGVSYNLSIRARTGDGQLEGLNLSLQDPSAGWQMVANQDFWFPQSDKGLNPGPWRTFNLSIDSSVLTSIVGHQMGVGVTVRDTTDWNQYGWLHIDSVSLTVVPEPSSLAILGLGAVGILLRRKR